MKNNNILRGLCRYHFYTAQDNFILYLCLSVIALLAVTIFDQYRSAITMIIVFLISTLPLSVLGCSQKDEMSSWNRKEASLPADRAVIVKAHYISYSIATLVACTISGLYMLLHFLLFKEVKLVSVQFGFVFVGLGFAFLSGGVTYPLIFKYNKAHEALALTGLITSVLLYVLFASKVKEFLPNLKLKEANMLFAGVMFIVFLVSYFVSVRIYRSREF